MELNLFNSITLLSLFLTSVLSFFFFITKKGNKKENIILALLLFLFSIQIFYSFAVSNYAWKYFINYHKVIFLLRQATFLTGPLIYFYVNSFLKKNSLFKKINLLHLLPFLSILIFLTIFYTGVDNFIIWKSKVDLFDTYLLLIHNLIYIVTSILSLRFGKITIFSFFRTIRDSEHIMWLQILLLGFIALWIVNVNSFALIMILKKPVWCAFTGSIFVLTIFLFMVSIMFLLLLKPEIYYIIEKYKYSSINEENKKEHLQRLNEYMISQKPYLNPDISSESVAKELSLNPKILSQIINEFLGSNFKSYINSFRIKESMNLLSNVGNNEITILEILYKSGFNSKSVFNYQFKNHTGLTPQEFREKQNGK